MKQHFMRFVIQINDLVLTFMGLIFWLEEEYHSKKFLSWSKNKTNQNFETENLPPWIGYWRFFEICRGSDWEKYESIFNASLFSVSVCSSSAQSKKEIVPCTAQNMPQYWFLLTRILPYKYRIYDFVLKLKPATLLKATFFHGYFSRFLNCTNGTKSHRVPQIIIKRITRSSSLNITKRTS